MHIGNTLKKLADRTGTKPADLGRTLGFSRPSQSVNQMFNQKSTNWLTIEQYAAAMGMEAVLTFKPLNNPK